MPLFSRISSFWRNLAHRQAVDRQLDDELRSYVDMLKQEKIASGMSPEQAHRAAMIEADGLEQVKEQVREARTGALFETTARDVRYAFRSLVKNPGFSATAVIALALGIGANTAIFSVVSAVLLRPLPYRDPDRLMVILHEGEFPVAPANFHDWSLQSESFEVMGAADYWTPDLTGVDRPEKIWALKMTSNMFPMLGVQPLLGRFFLPEEDQLGKEHEVVLSFRLWQRRFAGDTTILGQQLILNGEAYHVIGVMPRSFRFAPFWATKAELWVPLPLSDRIHDRRGANSLRVFARLKPNVALDQARAEMAAITGRLEKQYPGTNRHVTLQPLKEKVVGDVRTPLLVLLAAVGFVLLIACFNVAHLLLARASAREKEIALRAALGARRSRLIREFLTESVLLALLGGSLGLLLADVAVHALVTLASGMPRAENISLDARVVIFSLALSLLTAIIFGLVPAMQASIVDVSQSLKDGGHGSSAGGSRWRNSFRNSLVVSEFTLALVLLVGAGLLVRTFVALQAIDPGFNPHHLMTMVASISGSSEAMPGRRAPFFHDVVQRVAALHGVESASAINHLPLGGDLWGWQFWIGARPLPPPGDSGGGAIYRVILPGYFHTMQMTMIRGRDIDDQDNLNAPNVVVVNERLARKYFPGEDPIGSRITPDDPRENSTPRWLTIVGVVRDVKEDNWATPPDPELYIPYLQDRQYLEKTGSHVAYLTLVARTTGDPATLAPAIENAVHSIDKNVPLSEVQTMDQVVADSTGDTRFSLFLLAAFASLALALAVVGIYGVISYSVSRRTHEMGVRMALGAQPWDVLRLVIGQGMALAFIGVVAGTLAALGLTRLMATLLYGVRANDLLTYAMVILLLTLAALVACYLPARRATRIDPLLALRHE